MSDHVPVILCFDINFQVFKGFRFERMWIKEGFKDLVASLWQRPSGYTDSISDFCHKIRDIRWNCKVRCKEHFYSIRLKEKRSV